MKKIILACFIALFLAACSEPKSIVLNSKEDIELHSSELKTLNDEDKQLLALYIARVELSKLLPGVSDNDGYGITVGEAIERQKRFIAEREKVEAERERVEAERKSAEEKAQQEYERKIALMNAAAPFVFVSHEKKVDEYDRITAEVVFTVTNKSDKDIIGTKGTAIFYDKFGDELYRTNLKLDFSDIGGVLPVGRDYTFDGSTPINRFMDNAMKFASTPTSELTFKYQPEVVLFKDGTSIRAE